MVTGKQLRCGVLFQLGVSDHSKAYVPVSGENVAQFEVRKRLILLDNPGFGIPNQVVGGSNPSGRDCLSSTCDAELSLVALPQPNGYRVEIVASPRMLPLRSRATWPL